MRALVAAALAACIVPMVAAAAETPAWPPSDEAAARMRELQRVMTDRESTAAQREAAREELSSMLKSPAGAARRAPGEKAHAAPRAAIEPLGAIVKPAPNPQVSVPGVATLDVTIPPRITVPVSPKSARPIAPSAGGAVDPRTGHILHETPNGYIDPRTGQFTPR